MRVFTSRFGGKAAAGRPHVGTPTDAGQPAVAAAREDGDGCHLWLVASGSGAGECCLGHWRHAEPGHGGGSQEGGPMMSATTGTYLPAGVRASDSDRDGVVSDLSAHFQAGRLTAGEFDERMGRALAARTWGELRELLADLPAARPGPRAPAAESRSAGPWPPSGRFAPPAAALAGIGIVAAVLVIVATAGWGLAWLLLPALLIARRLGCGRTQAIRTAALNRPWQQPGIRLVDTRSEFFSRAARRYLDELASQSLTQQIDEALRAAADESDAAAAAVGRSFLAGLTCRPWPCARTDTARSEAAEDGLPWWRGGTVWRMCDDHEHSAGAAWSAPRAAGRTGR